MSIRLLLALSLALAAGCSAASSDDPADAGATDTQITRPGLDTGGRTDTGPGSTDSGSPDSGSDAATPDIGTLDAHSDVADDARDDAGSDTGNDSGADVGECTDECFVEGRTTCDDMGRLADCVRDSTTGCLTVQSPRGCGDGFICEGGLCVDDGSCEDECPSAAVITCTLDGAGFQTCIDVDDDGCLELSEPAFCDAGEVCSSGFCTSDCTDICEREGLVACDESGAVVTCGDYNFDGCFEYGDPTECGASQVCAAGRCEDVVLPEDCLLIGEYQEGSSFNKAVEIVNCGSESRNLAGLAIFTEFNSGSTTGQHSLSGTLAPGEVLVICHDRHAQVDSVCDQSSSSAINWNGNDRFVLFRDVNTNNEYDPGADELLDSWGVLGSDPGDLREDTVYRRTSCEPFLQVGGFDVDSLYGVTADGDDVSNLGTAPVLSCD